MVTKPLSTLHIYQNPESRIRFLETILDGNEWTAVVHDHKGEDGKGEERVSALARDLSRRDFDVHYAEDNEGNITLTLKKFGDESQLIDRLRDMKFAFGVRNAEKLPTTGILGAFESVKDAGQYLLSDTARMLGTVYLLGDVIIGFGGKGSQGAKPKNFIPAMDRRLGLANAFYPVMGAAAVVQSLIYMFYAKDPELLTLDDMRGKFDLAVKQGKSVWDKDIWSLEVNKKKHLLSGVDTFLKENPIETGAVIQMLGQVGFLVSGGIRYSIGGGIREKAKWDIGRSVASLIAWGAFIWPQKDHENKASWLNPYRWWQEFEAHPHWVAGGLNAVASGSGLYGSVTTRNEAGKLDINKYHAAGEGAYLVGDALMAFTKKKDYGAYAQTNEENVAKATVSLIESVPIVISPKNYKVFVSNIADYVVRKGMEIEHANMDHASLEAKIAARTKSLEAKVHELTVNRKMNMSYIVQAGAELVSKFMADKQTILTENLAEALEAMPNVYVSKEEWIEALNAAVHTQPATDPNLQIKDIAKEVSELVFSVPGVESGENALHIVEALESVMEVSSAGKIQLDHVMHEKAKEDLGLAKHAVNDVAVNTEQERA
jgi:hypothetical protein